MPPSPLSAVELYVPVQLNPTTESSVPFRNKGAVMLDLGGRIAFASTYFCELVGIEHQRVAGMSYLDFIFPEDTREASKLFEENKRLHIAPFRLRLRRTDGRPVWVDIQGAALQTAGGEFYAISATVTAAAPPLKSFPN